VTAWGTLAAHVLESLHHNDRVTVRAYNISADLWTKDVERDGRTVPEPHSYLSVRASDVSVSLVHDSATTGQTTRRSAGTTRPDLPAAEQADLSVLAGVTAPAV
jgi:pyrimidine operon attenuation protein/uracil phosphoribosyltransferase